jgi:integrase
MGPQRKGAVMARGSVTKRGNAWSIVLSEMAGEARKVRFISGRQVQGRPFRTKREAQEALARILVDRGEGTFVTPSEITVEAYMERWLATQRLKPATIASYQGKVKTHILPALGAIRLQQLRSDHLSRLYAQMLDRGSSPRTVQYVHAIIRKALKDATLEDPPLVRSNVADRAKHPTQRDVDRSRGKFKIWDRSELRAFLDRAREDRLYPLYHLAATSWLRRGEILGLEWRDVDLDAGKVTVRQTMTRVLRDIMTGTPKSDQGHRTVSIDSGTVAVLRAWKKQQLEERMYAGPAWQENGGVFTNEDGTRVSPDQLSNRFRDAVRAAEVPYLSFHGLRHTGISLALQAGVPINTVSERAGHHKPGFTLDRYGHVLRGADEQAAEAMGKLLSGDRQH